jgi:hypothetical protein
MAAYHIQRPDGSVAYTDMPQGTVGIASADRKGGTTLRERERTADEHQRDITFLLAQARMRGARLADYLDYLDYLRHYSPVRFDRVMGELRAEDAQAWMKLQKYPQFRPLRESAIGIKAAANIMGASAGMGNGKFGGSMEKWMESTLKDLMTRDRYGPCADVLGDKAGTLAGRTPACAKTRLGQYMKVEVARADMEAAKAGKNMAGNQAALRAAKGTAVVRPVGTVVEVLIAALNPDAWSDAAVVLLRKRMRDMLAAGVLSGQECSTAQNDLGQGKFAAAKRSLDAAQASYIKGGPK